MKQTILSIVGLLLCLNCFSQERDHRASLDYLNQSIEYPFITEKNIDGLCFITLSNNFDYYQNPILLTDKDNQQIASIEFVDTLGIITTFKGRQFRSYDNSNPFKPWLWVDNPDYLRLTFECTDSIGNFYKVRLNESEFAWIKKTDENFKKETIENFVLKWTSEPMKLDFNRLINPLKKEPKSDSENIDNPEQGKYKIWEATSLEIFGDWIKIKTIMDEIGWIKWRDGNKVLIRMYYAC
ncbi:hypothetical protein [Flammeovirga aprica]|uniref:Uncharacterized protein n=1 Tax=Flammeovirga aprica JL-4 TaxID=694437 RepID=A0A7X9RT68_9BACT|nr:hypothetical protein [Flammeovirga aprica]NME67996.1 hypothetical protein [Flammeovirga aprica JL-4]